MNSIPFSGRGLYAITYPALLHEKDLRTIKQALDSGLSALQYRDKSDDSVQRRAQARQLQQLCDQYHCPLIINDDVELCLEVGAAGVHLGQQDGDLALARQQLGNHRIIGATCHNSLPLAEQAIQQGADYIAFGRFFTSASKQEAPPADLSVLTHAKAQFNKPCIAIGGINIDNAQTVLDHGADMIALIQGLFGEPDVRATITAFRQLHWPAG